MLGHDYVSLDAPQKKDFFQGIIGCSQIMEDLFNRIKLIADSDANVLVKGESGTGKELIAKALHQLSPRAEKPFFSLNSGAIPRDLLESELFGHKKGSFTGAVENKKGKFLCANGGSLFFDEIGDMPLDLQVKLLRVLQEKVIEPVGENKSIAVDVRVIAATHRNLEKMVEKGLFREDLYYRLNVIPIEIPPLRERIHDIPALIFYFLEKVLNFDIASQFLFSQEVMEKLKNYYWPGNVRELENLVHQLAIFNRSQLKVDVQDLPQKYIHKSAKNFNIDNLVDFPEEGVDIKNMLNEIENRFIHMALKKTHGNKNKASHLLKLNRTTLIEKIKKKALEDNSFQSYLS